MEIILTIYINKESDLKGMPSPTSSNQHNTLKIKYKIIEVYIIRYET